MAPTIAKRNSVMEENNNVNLTNMTGNDLTLEDNLIE
jgi:hypothetical protein